MFNIVLAASTFHIPACEFPSTSPFQSHDRCATHLAESIHATIASNDFVGRQWTCCEKLEPQVVVGWSWHHAGRKLSKLKICSTKSGVQWFLLPILLLDSNFIGLQSHPPHFWNCKWVYLETAEKAPSVALDSAAKGPEYIPLARPKTR